MTSRRPPAPDEALARLDGLDDIPWPDLEHAYGPAADVPVALRALARPGDDPLREDLLDDLDASIYHQGGAVYTAGAAAVPFLIELAATPGLSTRAAIVELIGRFAVLQNEMREPWRSAGPALSCRAALVAGHDALVGLLDDADHGVRTAVAALLWRYALWSPRADEAAQALAGRDATEPDLALRVSLRLDGARATAEARASNAPSAGALEAAVRRLVEATQGDGDALRFARLAAARRLDPAAASWRDLLDAALAPTTPHDAYPAWAENGARLAGALCGLCGDDRDGRIDVVRALIGHERPQIRIGALRAAGDAMLRRRSATVALVPLIGALLEDSEPEVRAMSADLLAAAGEAGAAFDDALAAVLDDPHRPAAIRAVWALARHGDARAVPALVHALDQDENAEDNAEDTDGFGPSAHYSGSFYWFSPPPLREALVACAARHASSLAPALRAALARCLAPSGVEAADPGNGAESGAGDGITDGVCLDVRAEILPRLHLLCDALAACGSAAVVAGPELEALLASTHPQSACTVIEAAGPAAAHCVPHLARSVRAAVQAASAALGDPRPLESGTQSATRPPVGERRAAGLGAPWITALTVARTRFAVDGDERALLDTVDAVLALTAPLRRDAETGWEDGRPKSAEAAARARDAAGLANALARCLAPLGPGAGASRTTWPERWLRAQERRWRSHEAVAVARAHARVTGDSDLARQVFRRVLDSGPGTAYSQIELAALRAVAELRPEAREFAPLLRACLDRDERVVDGGGWRGMALDDEVQHLAATALAAAGLTPPAAPTG
ncbi:hypothetical protein OG562_33400 [Streptomyces sp. NBC_01275]|uniref:HEAT repeat domain-containing protein n=1 Tax=Streptomyces sp. NBC_01275 TaxID=2903807 RepID=UPI00225A7C5D|nr:HEAT repeat domain-containing protein [Streptomyces sp. NBC_01275]MCX4765789.1 hypothetical protein [Streptomyces sp. NBC_01275]